MTKHDAASGRADLSPHTNSVWLPAGTQRTVLIDGAVTPSFFTEGGPAVVEVGFDPAGDVVARIDGEVLGEFDGESSAQLSPSLRQLESRGFVALAHGTFTTVEGVPALTVHADPLGAPRNLAADDSGESGHPTTDPFPATEPFAADEEAEAAALAADASAARPGGSTAVRGLPRNRNLQAVAVLASAAAIGFVGVVGYSYSSGERGRDMTAFVNSYSTSTAGGNALMTPEDPSATDVSESPSASPPESGTDQSSDQPAVPEASSSGSNGSNNADGGTPPAPAARDAHVAPVPAPAPAPAPHTPERHVPAPNPVPAPAPAPAPADNGDGDNGNGSDAVPPPQPILEFRW